MPKRIRVNDDEVKKRKEAKGELKKLDKVVEKLKNGTGNQAQRLARVEKVLAHVLEILGEG